MPSIPGEVDEVHVGELAGVVDRAPGAADRGQAGRDHPVLDRPLEGLAEERREQLVLLAGGLDVPLSVPRPVPVGLRIGGDAREEGGLVHARDVEHHRRRQHLLARREVRRGAGPVSDVGVARGIDDAAGEDRLPARLRLGHDADQRVAVQDGGDERAVEHRVDARLLDEGVGDELEALGIELQRERLALRHRRSHLVRARLELEGDAAGLDGRLVPVPRHPLDADRRDVAAEAAEALDQGHLDPGAGSRQRGRQPRRARPDDEEVGVVDDVDLPGGLGDRAQRAAPRHPPQLRGCQSSRMRTATSSSSFAFPL